VCISGAGIVLVGTEVKSCRAGKCNIQEGYVRVDRDGQLKLLNCNIGACHVLR
jgi:SsrA-binding protein